jgi:hypothetical protein
MFQNNPKAIKLSEGIYLFKDCFSQDILNDINEKIINSTKSKNTIASNLIDWYENKIATAPNNIIEIWEQLSELIGPDYVMHPQLNPIVSLPGEPGMFVHNDSPGKGCEMNLTQIDTWQTCCIIDYGLVAYFGNFEGGEIFYPHLNLDGSISPEEGYANPCLTYKPENGDVIIHSAFHPYEHGTKAVTSGMRIAYSNFMLLAKDNPGSFYNYGTPEYYNQIGDKSPEKIKDWATALIKNPRNIAEQVKLKNSI